MFLVIDDQGREPRYTESKIILDVIYKLTYQKKLEYAKSWYICKICCVLLLKKVEFEFDRIACFVAPHVPSS